jgi:hypothetical protein
MTLTQLEASTADCVVARRNYFLGLWAGRKIGLQGDDLANYIDQVMASDFEMAGPDDVIAKIHSDFTSHGVPHGRDDVLGELKRMERSVRAELLATD